MIIKSITIENFRQYKNKNVIEFSTDPEKNVTVILGVNTSGKTTIIQAFNWCLYETTTFKSRDMLLNSELASSLPENGFVDVRVQIILVHEDKEFTIIRSQRFVRTFSGSKVRGEKSNLSVYYKESNGNSYPIKPYECANTINKILPVGLSDYFFFDGERIQDINNKKDVVSAVRGLMGLDVAKVAVDHLDPSKSNSVIRKLQNDLKVGSDDTSRTLQRKSEQATSDLEAKQERLKKVDQEIEFAQAEKERFAEILRSTAEVRGLQTSRDSLERQLAGTESSVKSAQDRLITDFNRDYFSFFIQPLLGRAQKVLSASTKQMEGIPEMNSKAIDYILKRGRCICGCDLTKNQGAVENIEYERSLLPPQHIGTMVRSFSDACEMWKNQGKRADLKQAILNDYSEIRRIHTRHGEIIDELKDIHKKIKELGSVNSAQIESDNAANDRMLSNKLQLKGTLNADIRSLQSAIADYDRQINSLAAQCKHNDLIRREIEYATAVYNWFRDAYNKQEKEVKKDLLESVNKIFQQMYHGSRQVTIDDNYHIQLTTAVGDEKISTDESKGLEAVKNFSFIAGLVELARKKARKVEGNSLLDEPDIFTTEPYPIVMDAPFSNVDEIHINNIARLLPEIAEQVILIVMKKDWAYAEKTMGTRVGASYYIEKVNNSDTYSTIRRV